MRLSRRAALRAGAASLALPLVDRAAAHPEPFEPLDVLEIDGAAEAVVGPDAVVYVAATTGFVVVDASDPTDLRVLAERRDLLSDRDDGPLEDVHDLKVAGDTLAVVGPANSGRPRAMVLYDVSDPANPVVEPVYDTPYPIHNSFLTDTHAYLTVNDGKRTELAIVDLTGDAPEEVARWGAADANPDWADVPAFYRSCHDVYVQDDVAYVAHWDAGTWLLDVTDPAAPTPISHVGPYDPADIVDAPTTEGYQLPGNHHYAAVNDDASVLAINHEAWDQNPDDDRNGGPGGISLYDLTDPANPVQVATIPAPPTPDPSYAGVWTTSHNFELSGDRLYTSWYQGGVKLFDVSDPQSPAELAWWRDPETAAFWTARTAPDCFVASSTPLVTDDTTGALYTFPDHPGQQPNPPMLTETTTRDTTTRTTATTTQTTTETSTSRRTTTNAADTTSGETPGFGALTTLLGATGAAAALAHLRDREPKD